MKHDFNYSDGPLGAAYFHLLPKGTLFGMCGGGGDMSGAYERAGAMQAQSAERAAALEKQMYEEARSDLAPWRTSGTTAETQIGSMLGLAGSPTVDPSAVLSKTPGYDWAQKQGVQALDRSAASRGMALSGAQQKGLTNYGQNLAMTYAYNPYMANLQAMSGRGAGAAGQTGQFAMQAGQSMGQDYMAAGNAQAQAQIQAAQAAQQNNQGMWGNIMSGLGMVGGLALAPFTGGTSLLGSALSGLGMMGGGGGGGGGGDSLIPYSNAYTPAAMGYSSKLPLYDDGGPVTGGGAIIVGGRGPEVFVPNQSGTIIPNHAIPQNEYSAFAPWRN